MEKKFTGQKLWNKAKKLIPGGSQLLSKRAEMFLPDLWPAYYDKAKGTSIWDLDGNKFVDMSYMGLGTCILGYSDPDVDKAVITAVDKGVASTFNCPEEVALADLLCKLHPWADMVKFTRGGGEALSVAVRIARAATGKDKVAFCGYHGWSDWYLAANLSSKKHLDGHLLAGLEPLGVPRGLLGTAIPFHYNNIDELEKIFKENKDIGVVVLEPIRHDEPKKGFLDSVRLIAKKNKAVLIFDEVTVGFRLTQGGSHLLYKVDPDIAVFGKAMANGYAMAAIIGKKQIMDFAQRTFISSTAWTERIGPVAALATIKKLKKKRVQEHIKKVGSKLIIGYRKLAIKHSLKLEVEGPPSMISINFKYLKSNLIKTFFVQQMLKRGYLSGTLTYITYAHREKSVRDYLKNVDSVFYQIKEALDTNSLEARLEGPQAHIGFARLT